MKTLLLISIVFFAVFSNFSYAQERSIHLNSLGFVPQSTKKASVIGDAKSFVIKQVTDKTVVYKGKISTTVFQKDVNQNVSS